jgi:hypothetical protein
MRLKIGLTLVFVCAMLVTIQAPVDADIYLARSDTGNLLLTNSPDHRMASETFKLITHSETKTSYDIPTATQLKSIVDSASEHHTVPEELIYAVIEVESDGETRARSHEGALGLMQLMPQTADYLGVSDPLNPRENIFGGTKYLNSMLARFDGDLDRALAAYNAGPTAVQRHGGIPPFEETRQFVRRVQRRFEHFKAKDDMIYTYRDEQGVLHVTNIH